MEKDRFWLIEMLGQGFMGTSVIDCSFDWKDNTNSAIKFADKLSAEWALKSIKSSNPKLFPDCLPKGIMVTDHVYIQ